MQKKSVESECAAARALYASRCLQSWVQHFDRKHLYEQFKAKTEGRTL